MVQGPLQYELQRLKLPTADFPSGQWCAVWFEGKQRRRYRLAVSLDDSEDVARLKLNEFVRRRERVLYEENKLTISDVMSRYFADREKEGKQVKNMRILWDANLAPVFGAMKAQDVNMPITVDGVQRTMAHKYAKDRQLAGMRRATIYHELNILKTGMKWAAAPGRRLIDETKVWLPRRSEPRDSQLTWEEIFRVYAECQVWPHLKIFMLLDMTTAQRKTAILELEWSRVNFERRQIDFRKNRDQDDILDTGGRKGRSIVDMGDLVFKELSEAKLFAQTPYIVEYRGERVMDVKKGLKAAFVRAGITKAFAGAHAIRKSIAGLLADAGEEMRKIQKLLGHHDIATTDRIYASHSRGYLMQAVGLLEAFIVANDVEPKGREGDEGRDGEKTPKIIDSRFDEPLHIEPKALESDLDD